MKICWVWLVVVGALGCREKGGDGSANVTGSASAPASAVTVPKSVTTCDAELQYLVPPTKYADADLIRAIVVDGADVFYRNMTEAFRVPLAGGAPTNLGKAPGLSLSGATVMWVSGDKLLTQSAGQPIFMSAPKAGGAWSNLIDLTAEKRGGGHDPATRVLHAIGGRGARRVASQADFDGQSFYFSEITQGKLPSGPASSALKSVPLAGGEARTLFEAPGEIRDVHRAGDHLSFLLTDPPTAEQVKNNEAERKAKKYVFGVRGETHLMSLPLVGGSAKKLMRIGPFMSGLGMGQVVLGVDGQKLYASGYREQDLTKPGIFRVDVVSGNVEQIDKRVLSGSAFVSGDTLVLIGGGMIDPTKNEYGQLVLTAPRQGKALTLAACTPPRKFTLHASAVSGKTALLGLFGSDHQLAGIAKVPLP
jgi:hypothetical protein